MCKGDVAHFISCFQPNAAKYRFVFRNKNVKLYLQDGALYHGKHEKDSGDCHKQLTVHEFQM